MASAYDLDNFVRDTQQVRKGGSNLLQFGLTDAEADQIWSDRFAHAVASIDDTAGAIVLEGDQVPDFLVGARWRLRATDGSSTTNAGLFTIAAGVSYDSSANETTVPVEESLSTESISGSVVLEPIWLAGGWHKIGARLMGGTISRERDVDRVFDETDAEVAEVVNSDEIQIARTVAENDERFRLFLRWLEGHYTRCRDFLPLTNDGRGYVADSGDVYKEGRFYPRASALLETREESVARDEMRTLEVTFNATRDQASDQIVIPDHGFRVVNQTTQDGWPAELADFKDDAYSTSRTTS